MPRCSIRSSICTTSFNCPALPSLFNSTFAPRKSSPPPFCPPPILSPWNASLLHAVAASDDEWLFLPLKWQRRRHGWAGFLNEAHIWESIVDTSCLWWWKGMVRNCLDLMASACSCDDDAPLSHAQLALFWREASLNLLLFDTPLPAPIRNFNQSKPYIMHHLAFGEPLERFQLSCVDIFAFSSCHNNGPTRTIRAKLFLVIKTTLQITSVLCVYTKVPSEGLWHNHWP